MTTRHVTDTLRHADGTPWEAAKVSFALAPGSYTATDAYPPDTVRLITDASGAYDAVLWCDEDGVTPTSYLATYPGSHQFAFDLPVGDETPISMAELRTYDAAPAAAGNLAILLAGYVEDDDARLSDARAPTGAAGGVLSGTYPSPAFAADMATQAELDTHAALTTTAHGGIVKPPLAMSFSGNGDIYFVAHEAMTLTTPTEAGTGTLAYTRALAAAPTSFSTLTFPGTLAVGDILKVTLSGISGYKAATLPRSA